MCLRDTFEKKSQNKMLNVNLFLKLITLSHSDKIYYTLAVISKYKQYKTAKQ